MLLVLDFCNSFALFKHYINNKLCKYLDIFYIAYLDNILIYYYSLYKHKKHIKNILKCLKNTSIFLVITKYEFYIIKILYLGFIISICSVKIDLAKIKTILN